MSKNKKKILTINFGGLGDQILFLPVLETLKNFYKSADITFVTESRSKSIINLTKLINKVIACDIKTKNKFLELVKLILHCWFNRYDIVVSSGASGFIPVILFLTGIKERVGYNTGFLSKLLLTKPAGLNQLQYAGNMYHDLVSYIDNSNEIKIPSVFVDENALNKMQVIITSDNRRTVLIHPGVSQLSIQKNIIKFWAPEKWAGLINKLISCGYRVVLSGGPDDREVINNIKSQINSSSAYKNNILDITGETSSIEEFAAAVKLSDAVVCVDSAPMHISVGLRKQTIALFGPTDEKKLIPEFKDRFTVIKNNSLDCRPCLWDRRQISCESPECLNISVYDVFKVIEEKLYTDYERRVREL